MTVDLLSPADRARLEAVFEVRRQWGFLGPGPVTAHVEHALRFVAALPTGSFRAADLGSGAGLPGLVLAVVAPDSEWVLIDSRRKRADALRLAVRELALSGRVRVDEREAQAVARDPEYRSSFDVVVARSFGSPAIVAECAAGLLKPAGHLVVSEPPAEADGSLSDRWLPAGLRALGFRGEVTMAVGSAVLVYDGPVPDAVPRRKLSPARW